MKASHAIAALVVALLLAPVVLSIGAFVLIPLALVLLGALPFVALFAVPALLVWIARAADPAAHSDPAPTPVSVGAYSR
jgi:hypothetical protein